MTTGSDHAARRRYDLVAFDLDGTLIETAPDIADALNACLSEIGLAPVAEHCVAGWIGQGTRPLLASALRLALPAEGDDLPQHEHATGVAAAPAAGAGAGAAADNFDALAERFDELYAQHCGQRSALYPAVAATLAELARARCTLALVTNKASRFTRMLLATHGLDHRFAHVVCGDQVRNKKPDPEGLLGVVAQSGFARDRCLYVGDADTDAETALRAGVAACLLTGGYNRGQALREHPGVPQLASFAALPAVVLQQPVQTL